MNKYGYSLATNGLYSLFIIVVLFIAQAPQPAHADEVFEQNTLQIVMTPDHYPIIWKKAQSIDPTIPIEITEEELAAEGALYCANFMTGVPYCSQEAIDAGAEKYIVRYDDDLGYVVYYYNSDLVLVGYSYNADLVPETTTNSVPDREYTASYISTKGYKKYSVGGTQGNLDINNSGAATYTIPIAVPPGTSGMHPQLALTYNSAAGNGWMGIGWSIQGLSSISRCSATVVQDGFHGAVNLDYEDRFCMDGQRLMLANDIAYGHDGAEYRTETDIFARFRSHGAVGNGPAYITMEAKDGNTYYYGSSSDSFVEAQGRTEAYVWALSKIEDRFGNYIEFKYEKAANNEYYRPSVIEYTKNDAQGLSAFASVSFEYESRPDVPLKMALGGAYKLPDRVKSIRTHDASQGEGGFVREYNIEYSTNDLQDRSHVVSINECTEISCLPPVQFEWQGEFEATIEKTSEGFVYTYPSEDALDRYIHGDYDGDGLPDVYVMNSNTIYLGNGGTIGGMYLAINFFSDVPTGSVKVGDFDGDGRDDLFYTGRMCSTSPSFHLSTTDLEEKNCIYYSNGDGTYRVKIFLITYRYYRFQVLDANGDGRSDIFYIADEGLQNRFYLFQEDGSFTVQSTPTDGGRDANVSDIAKKIKFADVNGDGLIDIYHIENDYEQQFNPYCVSDTGISCIKDVAVNYNDVVYMQQSDNTFVKSNASVHKADLEDSFYTDRLLFIDFNGDGKSDIYRINGWGTEEQDSVFLSLGDGTFSEEIRGPLTYIGGTLSAAKYDASRLKWGDFNGDGKIDVYYVRGDSSSLISDKQDILYFSTGNMSGFRKVGAEYVTKLDTLNPVADINRVLVSDYNGDGFSDILRINCYWTFCNPSTISEYKTKPLLINKIVSGAGQVSKIKYSTLADDSVYTPDKEFNLDVHDLTSPMWVVKQTINDAAAGALAYVDYEYTGAKISRERGFLGFHTVKRTARNAENTTADISVTTFLQTFPLAGREIKKQLFKKSGDTEYLVGTTDNIWKFVQFTEPYDFTVDGVASKPTAYTASETVSDYEGVYYPYLSNVNETNYGISDEAGGGYLTSFTDLDGTTKFVVELTNSQTVFTYDYNGNVLTTSQTLVGPEKVFTTNTVNIYDNIKTSSEWSLGRLDSSTVTHSATGSPVLTRVSRFEYYPVTGTLFKEIVEPSNLTAHDPVLEKVTTYTYDEYGNKNSVRTTAANSPNVHLTKYQYDIQGRYLETVTQVLDESDASKDQTEIRKYVQHTGQTWKLTGPNGLTTEWHYDDFGRKTGELRADGTSTLINYAWCATGCDNGIEYQITTTATAKPAATEYFDKLNLTIRNTVEGFDGRLVIEDMTYDEKARVIYKTNKHYADALVTYGTSYTYDDFDRVTKQAIEKRDGGIATILTSYGIHSVTVTDANGNTTKRTNDYKGKLISVVDALNHETRYIYDAIGNMVGVVDAQGNETAMSYSVTGNKLSMNDPDMGIWTYVHDGMDQLTSQKDAKNQTVSFEYDNLGRMVNRVDPEGSTTWVYDTAPGKGIGKLHKLTSPGYSEEYVYDTLGRVSSKKQTIDGISFTTSYGYDENTQQLITQSLPSGFTVKYAYNTYGYLNKVLNNANPLEVYWEANETDALGNVQMETLGNGIITTRAYDPSTGALEGIISGVGAESGVQNLTYTYDDMGNLLRRSDHIQQIFEEVTEYDALYRIKGTRLHDEKLNQDVVTSSYDYDAIGNITYKSDVGSYAYTGPRPHAVTTAGANSYDYDANGNQISGAGRDLSYSSFNKPVSIQKGEVFITYSYGADRQRIKSTQPAASGTETIYYLGAYERIDSSAGTEEKHFISANGKRVAVYTKHAGGSSDTRYLHHDHLGSTDVITDEVGNVVQKLSFDVFGKPRSLDWRPGSFLDLNTDITRWGYTGHEHIKEVGLIHMGGRVYDPDLGRFTSPDTFVKAKENPQGLNRYSYVENNPLNSTDPSGHFSNPLKKITKELNRFFHSEIGQAVISVAMAYASYQFGVGLAGDPFLGAGLGGGLSGWINGGNSDAFMTGAVFGMAFSALHTMPKGGFSNWAAKTLAHGALGGMQSLARGGKFEHGFLSAGFTQALSPYIDYEYSGLPLEGRVALSAVVGGTAAELGGGKFANGAYTGAFSRLFNDENGLRDKANRERPGEGFVIGPKGYWQKEIGARVELMYGESGDIHLAPVPSNTPMCEEMCVSIATVESFVNGSDVSNTLSAISDQLIDSSNQGVSAAGHAIKRFVLPAKVYNTAVQIEGIKSYCGSLCEMDPYEYQHQYGMR